MAKLRIFLSSFAMYALTAIVALTAAWQHVIHPAATGGVAPLEFTLQNTLIFVAVFVVFTVVMVRFLRVARLSLGFFLVVALLGGSQFVLSAWLGTWASVVGAVLLAVLAWRVPRVFMHDIAVIVGIAGVAALLGLSVTPLVAAVLLAGLSVYDIISVYRTRHMVALAEHMLASGAVFGFLVPSTLKGFLMPRREALDTRSVMMLGSGDIGLPLVLAASAVSQSIAAAALTAVFALIGVSLMHWLFAHQERPAPMAALPPIAVSAILGYFIAVILGI